MKTKTVRLNSKMLSYRLVGDVVQVLDVDPSFKCEKWITNEAGDEVWNTACDWPDMAWRDTKYRVGEQAILCSSTNIRTDSTGYRLVFDCPDGIPGNSNSNITRFHGWRGTNNDVSNDAHGLREIIKIRTLKNGTIAVTVGPDLRPDAD